MAGNKNLHTATAAKAGNNSISPDDEDYLLCVGQKDETNYSFAVENLEKVMSHFWNDTPANWSDTLYIASYHINFWERLSNELASISEKYVAGTFDDIAVLNVALKEAPRKIIEDLEFECYYEFSAITGSGEDYVIFCHYIDLDFNEDEDEQLEEKYIDWKDVCLKVMSERDRGEKGFVIVEETDEQYGDRLRGYAKIAAAFLNERAVLLKDALNDYKEAKSKYGSNLFRTREEDEADCFEASKRLAKVMFKCELELSEDFKEVVEEANFYLYIFETFAERLFKLSMEDDIGSEDDIKTLKKVYYLSRTLRETWMRL